MSVYHTIKEDIFTLTIEGDFETEAFFDAMEQGMFGSHFRAPMRALIDVRKAAVGASDDLPGEEDRIYAEIGHCFIPHWAIVAASDWTLFSIARAICAVTDLRGVDMRAYEDVDEARCKLTWSNFYQQDPFCRVQSATCRPHFVRPSLKA